jgi:hypothetical protein
MSIFGWKTDKEGEQANTADRYAPADFFDKLTASSAPGQLIGGGCFAIALTGSAHAPPIKAIELTAPQSE